MDQTDNIEIAKLQLEHNKEFWSFSHRMAIDLHQIWLKSQLIEFGYRLSVLIVGTIFAYLGYHLFLAGILDAANLEAGGHGFNLSLQKAAPGTFFALFGTAMIITGIWRLLPLPYISQPEVNVEPAVTSTTKEKSATELQAD